MKDRIKKRESQGDLIIQFIQTVMNYRKPSTLRTRWWDELPFFGKNEERLVSLPDELKLSIISLNVPKWTETHTYEVHKYDTLVFSSTEGAGWRKIDVFRKGHWTKKLKKLAQKLEDEDPNF